MARANRPPPRLLDRVRYALRTRHYSHRTEQTYVGGRAPIDLCYCPAINLGAPGNHGGQPSS